MNEYQRGHTRQCRVASADVRIAHVSDCYAPRTGGIETQVGALARAQAGAGHEVCVITATPGDGEVRAGRDHDGPVTLFRVAAHLPADIPVHPRTRRRVHQIVQAWRPDVIHIHSGVISPFAWGAFREAAALGVPRVVTVHSMWGPLAEPTHRWLDGQLPWHDPKTVISAVSSVAAQRVHDAVQVPVGVIPNGIDPALWPVQNVAPIPGVLRTVSVLRLAPRKRVGALIEILSTASRRFPVELSLQGRVIGDGPTRHRAQRLIQRHGLGEQVTLTGRLDRFGIQRVFAASDLFVQASVRESFGIAALEARTSGLPVLARAQTGAGEFLTSDVDGLLVDDDAAMVDALVDLATDRARLARWTEVAARVPPSVTWTHVLDAAARAYGRAIGAEGPHGAA